MSDIVDISSGTPRRYVLPHNEDLEASILGGILLHGKLLDDLNSLEIDDFYVPKHKVVFEAMRNLQAAGKPIDIVTLEVEIAKHGKLEAIGGVPFLGELALRVPTVDNVNFYVDQVRLDSRNRQVQTALAEALGRSRAWPHDPSELLEETIGELARIGDSAWRQGTVVGRRTSIRAVDVARMDTPPIRSYSTGNLVLDNLTGGGVNTRELMVVTGPPAAGKTAWAMSTSLHVQMKLPVLYASTELEQHELMARAAANMLGVPWAGIRRGTVPRDRVVGALEGVRLQLLGCDLLPADGTLALELIESEAARLAKVFGVPPLIVVDYLQDLARGSEKELRSRVGDQATRLRAISQRLDCPLIAISSVSRTFYSAKKAAEFREYDDASVYMIAAKESGDVDYAAARILFLDAEDDREKPERDVRIAVAKSRDGRVGFAGARMVAENGRWYASAGVVETMSRVKVDNDNRDREDDAKLLNRIKGEMANDGGTRCTFTDLRKGNGMSTERAESALTRLRVAGRIRTVDRTRIEGGKPKMRQFLEPVEGGST
jgi:replicative DNA helicase